MKQSTKAQQELLKPVTENLQFIIRDEMFYDTRYSNCDMQYIERR